MDFIAEWNLMCVFWNHYSRSSQTEIFKIGVTVEITSDEAIPLNELEDIVKPALDSRQIDHLRVERDNFYDLVAITGNFHFSPRNILNSFQFQNSIVLFSLFGPKFFFSWNEFRVCLFEIKLPFFSFKKTFLLCSFCIAFEFFLYINITNVCVACNLMHNQ